MSEPQRVPLSEYRNCGGGTWVTWCPRCNGPCIDRPWEPQGDHATKPQEPLSGGGGTPA